MILSTTERSYLYDSLVQKKPIRPDARTEYQYRPLEAQTSFLPSSNGSARIRLVDGSECIVSIKAKVVPFNKNNTLIECDIDLSGHRDDSNFISNLKFNLTNLLVGNFPTDILKLTTKYTYKLFIDCLVISHSSYPLTLLSLTTYLALKTTKLPLLISDIDDENIEEQPTFSDDWEDAQCISKDFQPPIFITIGVVGNNLLFDPSVEEEQVLENGLIFSWFNNKIISPASNINLACNSNNSNFKGMNIDLIQRSMSLVKKYSGSIVNALDMLIQQDDNNDGRLF